MIHGGAGAIFNKENYDPSIQKVLAVGSQMLAGGASALDVVEHCIMMLEDDPLFNAGRGSVLNEDGQVEMDAAIMSGVDLKAGSVAGVVNIKNPIHLARLVMEKTEHVMLMGKGAMKFAQIQQVIMEEDSYFITERRAKQLAEAKQQERVVLDHQGDDKKFGTVGAVARDVNGNLAAATSTGGITNKKFGRVGDSPIIGAGLWAENDTAAISATGYGEQFIRTALCKMTAEIIRYQKVTAEVAAKKAIEYLVAKVKGLGGIIVIDKDGNCGRAYSTDGMICGQATAEGIIVH